MRAGIHELEVEIGRGGLGAVWRGRGPDGVPVAIKLLRKRDAGSVARFAREARLQELLSPEHGFVPILGSGLAGETPYLVLPYLPGGTLRDRLRRGPLALAEAAGIVRTLAEALGRAHARGIVHRDLKPENVLFDAAARPLVADLGLAKHFRHDVLGASQSVDVSGERKGLGTLGYASPEQVADARTVGPAADVFALGAILYELLARRPAFDASGLIELHAKVAACAPVPVRRLRPDVPGWLAAVVEKALAREPSARFQDGAALASALAAGGSLPREVESRTEVALPTLRPSSPLAETVVVRRPLDGTAPATAVMETAPPGDEPRRPRAGRLAALGLGIALALGLGLVGLERGLANARVAREEGERRAEADFLAAARRPAASREARATLALGKSLAPPSLARPAVREALAALEAEVRAQEQRAQASRLLAAAEGQDAEGKNAQARFAAADAAIARDPSFPDAYVARARARLELARYRGRRGDARTASETDLSTAVRLDPALLGAWWDLEALAEETPAGRQWLRRRCLERIREQDPAGADGALAEARLAATAHDYPRALELLERAATLAPRDPRPLLARARVRLLSGTSGGIVPDLEQALALAAKPDPGALVLLADARAAAHDLAGASAALERALALDASCARALGLRALMSWRTGDSWRADADRALELDEGEPLALTARATSLAFDPAGPQEKSVADPERRRAARALLDSALERDEDEHRALLARATIARDQGDDEGVLADCDRLVALHADDAWAHGTRASVHVTGGGDLERARADLDVAVRRQPDYAPWLYLRGLVAARWSPPRPADAARDFDAVIRLEPGLIEAYYERGCALADTRTRSGLEASLRDFDRVLELMRGSSLPMVAMSYLRRGFARLDLGRLREGIADLDLAEPRLEAAAKLDDATRAITEANLRQLREDRADARQKLEAGGEPR